MSYNNPNVTEVLANSRPAYPQMVKHMVKSYLNLAKGEFHKLHNRKATLDDAQELYNLYENYWVEYYVFRPIREKNNRAIGKPIWAFGVSKRIDVYENMCRFIETILSMDKFDNAGDIMKRLNIEFIETYIMENDLLEQWKAYASKHGKRHHRSYTDYSHLAYSGVTDDF